MDRRAIVFLKHKHSKGFEYAPNIVGIERQGNIYRIDFGNGKSYNYSTRNVRYYKLKQTHRRVRLYDNGQLRGRYDELDDYGDYLMGYHSDTQTDPMRKHEGLVLCPINSDQDQGQRLLAYYKTILEQGIEVSRDMPNDEAPLPEKDKQSIRDIQLSALEHIDLHESQSVCSYYMEGTIPPPTPLTTEPIIYPFGCNESQKLAVETALSHSVSVIEGPPGTGKTQTILNIIANLVVQGKTVAVVSNNNAAVFNVRDKLTKYGYGGLVASLGNKENRAAFFNSLPKVTLPESVRLAKGELQTEHTEVGRVAALLSQSFGIRSSLAKLKTQLLEAEIEQQHLLEEQPLEARVQMELDTKFLRKLDYQRILSLKDLLEDMMRGEGKIPWLGRLRLMLSFGLLDQRILGRYREELLVYANHKFYELYIAHLKVEIASKEAWLVDHDEDKLLKDLTERSRKVFEAMLLERKTDTDEAFTLEKYKQEFDSFVRHYPIVISSTLSLPMSIPRGYLFDYLIIDEASQVDSIKGAISFACSKRAVIVGDSMQLAHIVDSRSQAVAGEAFAACTLPEPYDYVRHSILSSLKSLLGVRLQCTLLKEHYRCHPAIIGFCNKKYYDGQLVVMTEGGGSPFKIIETNIANGNNDYSQRQIDETDIYIRSSLLEEGLSVGVLTPYRKHANGLQATLPKEVEADTIHRYQGREKDIILFNTARPEITSFMDNPNLINVAVSRAIREFIVVKPEGMELPHGTNVGDLIRYMMYHAPEGCQVIKGQLRSVFDILYRALGAQRAKPRGMFDAEDIVCTLLRDNILAPNTQFASLTFIREYSLRDLVRNLKDLSPEERLYVKHNARLDFLLYSKLDKSPVLAIEVDGVTFHSTAEQQTRDRMKNRILEVIGLPLLRLSTDGHSEEQRIVEALEKAIDIRG